MNVKLFVKKTLALIVVFAMLSPILSNLELNLKEVQAADSNIASTDCLNVKCQVTDGKVTDTTIDKYRDKYVMRFVSSIDASEYESYGFKISYIEDGKPVTKVNRTNLKFTRIDSTTGSTANGVDTYNFSPKVVSVDSEYLITAKWPVAEVDINKEYTVWAFAETSEGDVEGPKRTVSVADGLKDCKTLNMTFELEDGASVAIKDKLIVNDNADYSAEVIGVDTEKATVSIRISGVAKSTLSSVTMFTFVNEEGTTVGSGSYRNLYTEYDGKNADTSWYNTTDTKFTIASSADLYGLASIVNGGNTLTGKTIYMISDIVANNGTASANGWTQAAKDGTNFNWMPIGQSTTLRFEGDFDGQNHTISGIFLSSEWNNKGLFGVVAGECTIQNLKLDNSYIYAAQNVGSIVGQVNSNVTNGTASLTIKNVTSNAHLTSTNTQMGGMVGLVSDKSMKVHMEECTFSGTLNSNQSNIGGMVGLMAARSSGTDLTITRCYFTGTVGGAQVGGFVGGVGNKNATLTITDCVSTGKVSSTGNVGGIIGKVALTKSTTISGCTVKGSVLKNDMAVDNETYIGETVAAYIEKVTLNNNTWSANTTITE